MAEKLTYTNYDFDTIKQNLIEKLAKEDVFKDYNFAGSNINTLLELVAAVGDLFGFYLNMTANESFIGSATLFSNLNKLAELVGYKVTGYTSSEANIIMASVPASYNLTSKNTYKIFVPKYSRFTCSEKTDSGQIIYFTNPNDVVYIIDTSTLSAPISAQSISITIPVVQGNPLDVGSELSYTATGEKYQKYEISELQAIENNLIVTVDDVEWTQVDNLYTDITSTSKVYSSRYNKDKKIEIRFGDGNYGVIPSLNSSIKIRYITSLGFDGNVNANIITGFSGNIYETTPSGVTVTLSNSSFSFAQPEISSGGSNPETEEEIRQKVPSFFRTQNRAVTKQDYVDLLTSNFNEFIFKCKALNYEETFSLSQKLSQKLTTTQINTLRATLIGFGLTTSETNNIIYSPQQTNRAIFYNNIYILIVPKFGETLTETLRTKLDSFLESHKLITLNHVYLDAEFIPINVTVTYTKTTSTTRTNTEIEMLIRDVLTNYFTKENRDLGELVIHGELVTQLSAVDGVKSIILDLLRSDAAVGTETNANIQLKNTEFPKLGTITIVTQ